MKSTKNSINPKDDVAIPLVALIARLTHDSQQTKDRLAMCMGQPLLNGLYDTESLAWRTEPGSPEVWKILTTLDDALFLLRETAFADTPTAGELRALRQRIRDSLPSSGAMVKAVRGF
jgi:hypothetical protein